MSEILILNTQAEHVEQCAALQPLCYPTLAKEEQFTAEHFANHVRLFPEGQFVAIERETGRVVGSTSGFLTYYDRIDQEHFRHHKFIDAIAGGWLTNHNPRGNYYYGVDMCVHPDYRGRGIARKLHDARKALCKRLNLKGQVIGGMIPGFVAYKHVMTAQEYVRYVQAGLIYDSTLTTQLRNGFVLRGMLQNYLDDPPTDGWSTLLEWRNPDYIEFGLPTPRVPHGATHSAPAADRPHGVYP
ncbi:MAG: GNAT family N-acetyltransferase [Anaerolineae bacterium]|nr:GNAT family N-acetyltransferase [Candidatus Roseilinea sp.]MDW8448777.1 GNAT family N-acetyltransferase [Anaerolineae bacterium]